MIYLFLRLVITLKNKRNYLIRVSLRKKIKSKWFIGINIFLFIIMMITININTIINLFGGDYKETKYVYVKDNLEVYDRVKEDIDNASKYSASKIEIFRTDEDDEVLIKKAKENNNILLFIDKDSDNYIKAKIYSNNGINDYIKNVFTNSLNKIRYDMALKDANLSQDIIQRINASVKIDSIVLIESNNSKKNKNNNDNSVIGVVAVIVFTMPFFFIITTLVQMIGAEINEEKSTKAMEIIIANVEPKEHLKAKILSCTMFTIIQIVLLVSYVFVATLVRNKTGINIDSETNRLLNQMIASMISPSIVKSMIRIIPLLIIFLIFTLLTYFTLLNKGHS